MWNVYEWSVEKNCWSVLCAFIDSLTYFLTSLRYSTVGAIRKVGRYHEKKFFFLNFIFIFYPFITRIFFLSWYNNISIVSWEITMHGWCVNELYNQLGIFYTMHHSDGIFSRRKILAITFPLGFFHSFLLDFIVLVVVLKTFFVHLILVNLTIPLVIYINWIFLQFIQIFLFLDIIMFYFIFRIRK